MEETLMVMAAETNPSQNPNQPPVPPPPAPGTHIRTGGAPAAPPGAGAAARMARPQKEKALNCPRCYSTNTKFCYYNNYSLQMPRYFCKTCRRYWTEGGGSLRNVPVGAASRKKKDAAGGGSSSTVPALPASSGSGTTIPVVGVAAKNPTLTHEGARDLELALKLPRHGGGRGLLPPEEFPSLETCGGACSHGDAGSRDVGVLSAMELLRSTGCYVPSPRAFALGEFRMPPPPPPPSRGVLGFSLETHGTGAYSAGLQRVQEESVTGRLLFPFEDLKPAVSAAGGANAGGDQYDAGKDEGGDGEASCAR